MNKQSLPLRGKSITVHTLVQNEEKYLWFSVMSVIDYVDKVFIWDTGSTDKTLQIIREIKKAKPGKVNFREVGKVDPNEFTSIRQQMLAETKTDWLILVDGDEVWWEDTIKQLVSIINKKGDLLDSVTNRYTNLVGDIYHHQDNSVGRYNIDGKIGYLTIRAMNREIKGLKVDKPHGQQGFFDGNGTLIQEMDSKRRMFIDRVVYLHFTNLPRSSEDGDSKVPKRSGKLKYELAKAFPLDFYYPEVFFRSRPEVVDSPWIIRSRHYAIRAGIETPLKMIKRKLLPTGKSGY